MEFDFEKAARSPWVAGVLGSVVSLRWVPGATVVGRMFHVGSGTVCAGFISPALTEWLHVAPIAVQSGLAFAVGLFGLSLAAAATEAIKAVGWAEVIKGWVSRKG